MWENQINFSIKTREGIKMSRRPKLNKEIKISKKTKANK
jgi:hypothetical protein